VDDLQAYYRRPIQAIADGYWRLRERDSQPLDPSSEAVAAFYQTTDRYVYESSYLEALAEYQWYFETIRCACAQYRRAPVLDFGGGAGGLTLTLALAGLSCDYADVPGPTFDYVRWRLARHQCASQMRAATEPLPGATYQAIVALDVFEHLVDLRGTLTELAGALVPGGWLISKSTFSPDDPYHLPQNMIYATFDVFNRLMGECGLTYQGRLRPDPLSELRFRWWHQPRILRVRLDPKPKVGGRFVVHQRQPSA
jgi:2-polyprenyl-3-methyl-5-hydroxy-6-metoxy-1,4-benzoquinol methylase